MRRVSTQPDIPDSAGQMSSATKRTVTLPSDTPRRPSLATISKRLSRSKKSSINTPQPNTINNLGKLFFALPNDIHIGILSFLTPTDILALRLTSKTCREVLDDSAPSVTLNVLQQLVPSGDLQHLLNLHPPASPHTSLTHLLLLWRRHTLISTTSSMLASFMQMKIYMLPPLPNEPRRLSSLDTAVPSLLAQFYPALTTINHYLETHRTLLLHDHPTHNTPSQPRSKFWTCTPCATALHATVSTYPPTTLLQTHHTMRLLIYHLKSSSRAPAYAGTLERAIRRWSKRPAGEEELAIIVLLGGLDWLRRVTVLKGTFTKRIDTLRLFLEEIEEAVELNALVGKMPTMKVAVASARAREPSYVTQQFVTGRMVLGARGIEKVVSAPPSTSASTPETKPTSTGQDEMQRVTTEPNVRFEAQQQHGDDGAEQSPIASLALNHALLTEAAVDNIPILEEILLPLLRKRIEAEGLLGEMDELEREREFESPFFWVRRVVAGLYTGVEGAVGAGEEGEGESMLGGGGDGGNGPLDEQGQGGTLHGQVHAQQQQQQQHHQGRRGSASLFNSMSRHMLVSVGRDD
jgi:hypothetical protein